MAPTGLRSQTLSVVSHRNVTIVVWYILAQLSSLIEKIPSTN
jgi:hypothetical protein